MRKIIINENEISELISYLDCDNHYIVEFTKSRKTIVIRAANSNKLSFLMIFDNFSDATSHFYAITDVLNMAEAIIND